MADERAMWAALPNGLTGDGRLRLTLYVTPRLTLASGDAPQLGSFPAFSDWPAALAQAQFQIEVQGGPTVVAEPDPDSARADSATWTLLFPPTTPVGSREFNDLADRRIRSFPFSEVLASVGGLYGSIAADWPARFPTPDALRDHLGKLGRLSRHRKEFYGPIDSNFVPNGSQLGGGVVAFPGDGTPELAFAHVYRFYDRPGSRFDKDEPNEPPPPKAPEIDFHGACAALADYPELMRRLGLAVDLVTNATLPASGKLRVAVEAPPGLSWMKQAAMRPWTRYLRETGHFFAEPRNSGDLDTGMLDLANERFVLTDMDVDGSGMKVVDFAGTLWRLADHAASGDPDGVSLPVLRNAGITVARRERALGVAERIAAASKREASSATPDLFADDVTRGYRIDVFDDKTGEWRSLCRREGSYLVERGSPTTLDIPPDEGYVKGASTTSVPEWMPGADTDLYLHEAVFGWDGWSMVAPRPGRPAATVPGESIDPVTDNPCALTVTFTPERGSLPALRYGHTYLVRARAVDLAGNSYGHDDPAIPIKKESQPFEYLRWDPVPSPPLVPRRPYGEGESLMRMVIRSTLGVTAKGYSALQRIKALEGHEKQSGADGLDRSYRAADERHVAPPKTAIQMAEAHGCLDEAFGDRPQATRDELFAIAAREAGTLMDVEIRDPGDPTAMLQLDHVHVVNQSVAPTDLSTHERGAPLKRGEYVVHDTDKLILPYLPDPLARGAAFLGLPGQSGVRQQRFDGNWSDRKPFRIALVEGSAAPKWQAGKRLLTVSLPQAEVARVPMSCFLDPNGDLDLLAVWDLLTPSRRAQLKAMALAGQHWMLTPSDELVLVHAVEKPLEPPVFSLGEANLERAAGETFVSLAGTLAVHAKSTERLDIESSWSEPIDDLARPGPETIEGATHVADFNIEPSEDVVRLARDDTNPGITPIRHRTRHEFGDTKHRLVEYRAIATTRFREYFPAEITSKPELITHEGPPNTKIHVPSSRRPDPAEVLYVVPTFRWDERVMGARQSPVRPGRPSARPGMAPTLERTRRGGGLRVYLDRPWYSSGADEHLAVVLPNQKPPILIGALAAGIVERLAEAGIDRRMFEATARRLNVKDATPGKVARALADALEQRMEETGETPAALSGQSLVAGLIASVGIDAVVGLGTHFSQDVSQYVTQWGLDPIWSGPEPPTGPRIQSFTNATAWATDLSLTEAPGRLVAAAAFEPSYDEDRKLWYCDIDVDAGSAYFPFIRMSLARYQPYSIPGTELSRVVRAEFAQLTPDRTATVRSAGGGTAVAVSVRGVIGINAVSAISRLVVARVERVRGAASKDIGWAPIGDRIVLKPGSTSGLEVRWSGTVPLPEAKAGFSYRIAVEEHELYETDTSQAEYDEMGTPVELRGGAATGAGEETPVRGRMIYADHFGLEAGAGGVLRLKFP
jgi:hypothetical protein